MITSFEPDKWAKICPEGGNMKAIAKRLLGLFTLMLVPFSLLS
jgi:hypothetical protein